MRLSRLQAIHKYKYSSIDQFTAKLVETNVLEVCRGYYEPIIVNVDEDIFYKPDLPKANKQLIINMLFGNVGRKDLAYQMLQKAAQIAENDDNKESLHADIYSDMCAYESSSQKNLFIHEKL